MTDLTLTVEHTIKASPKAVFDAWLDPDMLRKFMLPDRRVALPYVTTDPRVGGRFVIVMQMGGKELPHTGEYREIDPHSRLAFTWYGPSPADDSTVTLQFAPTADGTHITLTHDRFINEDSRDDHKLGWSSILEAQAVAMNTGVIQDA